MPECKISILIALPAIMPILLTIGGIHVLTMYQLHRDIKKLEVIDKEIFYLDTKIEQLRQMIAPIVIRSFSIRNSTGGVGILYRDKVVWKGNLMELNTTYTLDYFGQVILTHSDGRAVVMTEDKVFKYEPRGEWNQSSAYFVDYIMEKLRPLIEASEREKAEREELQERISKTKQDPYIIVFLAMPAISIVARLCIPSS